MNIFLLNRFLKVKLLDYIASTLSSFDLLDNKMYETACFPINSPKLGITYNFNFCWSDGSKTVVSVFGFEFLRLVVSLSILFNVYYNVNTFSELSVLILC